ncbi:MAG: SPL family radical SAM protein [Eubacteriales bacterium]
MHYIQAKTILSAKNGINIYRGCTHGCIYCDSRSECYQMEHHFEDIAVKQNAPLLLEAALRKKRKPCIIGTGSMYDPYMHCEETLGYTRKCLEIIDRYHCGVTVLTKSDRILRDIDFIDRINRNSKAVVQMTMTTYDETLCRIIEPGVCTTGRRYEVLKECRKRGIPTVVWLCPILPFINDTEKNLRGILDYCFDAGVVGIINFGFGVTLRRGSRDYFYRKLDEHFPGLRERYQKRFGDAYECTSDNAAKLWSLFQKECMSHGVMTEPNDIFAYLQEYPIQSQQLRLFN